MEDSGELPLVAETLVAETVVAEADGCSPVASTALEHACARAARRGDDRARGLDLLAAVVVDPGARAVEVLARAGIDARELAGRLDTAAPDIPALGDGDGDGAAGRTGAYAKDGGSTAC